MRGILGEHPGEGDVIGDKGRDDTYVQRAIARRVSSMCNLLQRKERTECASGSVDAAHPREFGDEE